jgi:hypothetical protein
LAQAQRLGRLVVQIDSEPLQREKARCSIET